MRRAHAPGALDFVLSAGAFYLFVTGALLWGEAILRRLGVTL